MSYFNQHPAAESAIELEAGEDHAYLDFHKEYNLNDSPRKIDALIVLKEGIGTDQVPELMHNDIFRFFRKFNVIQYKAARASMSLPQWFNEVGYACSLLSGGYSDVRERTGEGEGKKAKAIKVDPSEITLTLIRDSYPRKLLSYMKSIGCKIENPQPGIFRLDTPYFPAQIILPGKLNPKEHPWLYALSSNVDEDLARFLISQDKRMADPVSLTLYSTLMRFAINKNRDIFKKLMEDDGMKSVLAEIMEPELKAAEEAGEARGLERGLERGRELGMDAVSSLFQILLGRGDMDLINRVAGDKDFRMSLLKEYKLI